MGKILNLTTRIILGASTLGISSCVPDLSGVDPIPGFPEHLFEQLGLSGQRQKPLSDEERYRIQGSKTFYIRDTKEYTVTRGFGYLTESNTMPSVRLVSENNNSIEQINLNSTHNLTPKEYIVIEEIRVNAIGEKDKDNRKIVLPSGVNGVMIEFKPTSSSELKVKKIYINK